MKHDDVGQYLIVGARSDIGRELIKHLEIDEKNKILAVSRSDFYSGKSERENVTYLTNIDLTDQRDLEILRSRVENFFDKPFTAIHSVGEFWYHKPLVDTPFEEARRMIESHYLTLFGLAHVILPVQKALGGGKLIAFSCNSVGYNYPDMAAFTSAKAAVESLVKCIANEYSRDNIVANSIALSTIFTEKVKDSKNPKYFDGYITVDELAGFILETIAELSPLVNGNTIRLLKYSPYFYNEGYFQRNSSKSNI